MTHLYSEIEHCRVCDTGLGAAIVKIDALPIGDALAATPNNTEMTAPLSLHYCHQCDLLQLGQTLAPHKIYNEDYPYFSSAIPSLVERMRTLSERLIERYNLDSDSRVIEVASNDGYCLQHFKTAGVQILGVEPAAQQAKRAESLGVKTVQGFFTAASAEQLVKQHGRADLLIANNVVAHVADIDDFMQAVSLILTDDGNAVFEFHSAAQLLEQTQFDTLYHQHIYYFSLHSFNKILARHKLVAHDVELIDIYGGSLRVHVSRHGLVQRRVEAVIAQHATAFTPWSLQDFAERFERKSRAIYELISKYKNGGQRIVAYGAAAKASTLLASSGISAEHVDYVVDINPEKHGLYLPGTGLPIKAIDALSESPPDFVLILAWNYADEIMQELRWFADAGGRFILPAPSLQVI